MTDKKKNLDLGSADIKTALFVLSLPAIISQVVNVLYNVVDRSFIGHIPEVGAIALTGVGVAFSVVVLIFAFAALFAFGSAPRANIFLGRGDLESAEKTLGNSVMMLIICGITLSLILFFFNKPILYAFGASDNTIGYASSYMRIYSLGIVFVLLTLGLNAFILVQGFSKISMFTILIGAGVNIILDFILIKVLNLGVKGAATGLVISQFLASMFALRFLTGDKTKIRLRKENLKLEKDIALPAVSLGLAPFLMQSTEALLMLSFNSQLLKYGGDLAVGTMAITASLMQFTMLPVHALTQGGQALLSFNFGAGNLQRVKDSFKYQTIACLTFTGILWLLFMTMPRTFAGFFTQDPALLDIASWAIRIYFAVIILFGIQISCQQTFIAFGDAKTSAFLALFRKVLVLIPLIFILPNFFSDKVFGVFLAEPVADTIAVITTATLFIRKMKQVNDDLTIKLDTSVEQ